MTPMFIPAPCGVGGFTMPDGTPARTQFYGALFPGQDTGVGLFSGMVDFGTFSAQVSGSRWTTDAVDGEIAGIKTPAKMANLSVNPTLKIKFKSLDIGEKAWVGFLDLENIPQNGPESDRPLDGHAGAMCGFTDTDDNFMITWSNGSTSDQVTDTGVPLDTNLHTVEFIYTDADDRLKVNFDDVEKVNSTTVIPTSGSWNVHSSTESVGGTASRIEVGYVMYNADAAI